MELWMLGFVIVGPPVLMYLIASYLEPCTCERYGYCARCGR